MREARESQAAGTESLSCSTSPEKVPPDEAEPYRFRGAAWRPPATPTLWPMSTDDHRCPDRRHRQQSQRSEGSGLLAGVTARASDVYTGRSGLLSAAGILQGDGAGDAVGVGQPFVWGGRFQPTR